MVACKVLKILLCSLARGLNALKVISKSLKRTKTLKRTGSQWIEATTGEMKKRFKTKAYGLGFLRWSRFVSSPRDFSSFLAFFLLQNRRMRVRDFVKCLRADYKQFSWLFFYLWTTLRDGPKCCDKAISAKESEDSITFLNQISRKW